MALEDLLDVLDRKRITSKVMVGDIECKLYLPKGVDGPLPAVLYNQGLVSGAELGIANFFPRYLTGLGMAVLVPVYEGHVHGRVDVRDTEHVVSCFEFLRDHPMVDSSHVGMLGLSYGGLLSLVAAQNDTIASDIDFVVSVAAPTDLFSSLIYARTNPAAASAADELTQVSVGHFIDEMVLSCDDDAVYRDYYLVDQMLKSSDVAEICSLYDSLGPYGRVFFDRYSPLHHFDNIQTRLLIVHGKDDKLVPYEQAELLQVVMASEGKDMELIGIDGLGHIILVHNFKRFLEYAKSEGKSTLNYIVDFMKD